MVLIISGSSTAASLVDRTAYPNLVRALTPDNVLNLANVDLMKYYGWKMAGTIDDKTVWGSGATMGFREMLLESVQESKILAAAQFDFLGGHGPKEDSVEDFERVLDIMVQANVRIIFSALNPEAGIKFLAAVYQTKKLYGKGYAWITAWTSYDTFRNPDQSVSADAVKAADGQLGFVQAFDTTSTAHTEFLTRWHNVAKEADCIRSLSEAVDLKKYCDANGDQPTLATYSPSAADAVLAFAMALDKLHQSGSVSSDDLYQAILSIEPFKGVSASPFR